MNGALIIVAVVVFAGAALLIANPSFTLDFNHLQTTTARPAGNPLTIISTPPTTPAPAPAAQAAPGARLKAPAPVGTALTYHTIDRYTNQDGQEWTHAVYQVRTSGQPGRLQFITKPPENWNYNRCEGSECMAVYRRPTRNTSVLVRMVYDSGIEEDIDVFEG